MTAAQQAQALGWMAALGAAAGLCYDLLGRLRRGRLTAGAADLLLRVVCGGGMAGIALRLRVHSLRFYAIEWVDWKRTLSGRRV